MAILPDGAYDVIVIDVETTDDGDTRLELTITIGPHVGSVLSLRGRHVEKSALVSDPLSLLGIPGTLRVRHGTPRFLPELP